MSRKLPLSRADAEYLVDLIERDGIPQFMIIAAYLRAQWGMVTKQREDEYRNGLRDKP